MKKLLSVVALCFVFGVANSNDVPEKVCRYITIGCRECYYQHGGDGEPYVRSPKFIECDWY